MTEFTEGQPAEKVSFDRSRDLSRIEHVLINSSVPDGFNFSVLNQQLERGFLDPQSLEIFGAPANMTEEEALALQNRRVEQTDLTGIYWFLDFEGQREIEKRGFLVRFQPIGHIDHTSRIAEPIWRISAFNPNAKEGEEPEAQDPEIGKLIMLDDYAKPHLGLGPTLKPGSRFLFPNRLKKKHEYK